ncbi:fimbrial protein [Stenotrophomonas rhizophila]|uniref:fimbrial protein n=1 Tax=Stenotrophomonas rhizophila TaxID=216778 RepID=UPI001E53AB06|nr:hypothetical protein [Stenotrophomonas rhizophila]MCC7634890.1 type 1 fimbrial protein [Stenotrophomonas rhizophila]MCC7664437.1 type 1 fimbrial protein [Stenotrophomonas rhizophila]
MKSNRLLVMSLLAIAVAVPGTALAACTRKQSDVYIASRTLTLTGPNAVPVGSLIPTRESLPSVDFATVFFCDGDRVNEFMSPALTKVGTYGAYGVFASGVAGVGLIFDISDPNYPLRAVTGAYSQPMAELPGVANVGSRARVRLVRTAGTIPSGRSTISQRRVAFIRLEMLDDIPANRNTMWLSPWTLNVTSPTCNLAVGDVDRPIRLAPAKPQDFVGQASVGRTEFELTADCNADASVATFAFNGTPYSGDGAYFANTGTARGVGVALFSRVGGTDQAIRADGTGNTRNVNVSAGRAVLPLGVSYRHVNAAEAIVQGGVSAVVSVDLTYN